MGALNKVMLIGNLGADPEVRTTPSGAKIATFSIATTEHYTDKSGEKKSHTEWHRLVLWKGLADVAESYLKKGSSCYFEGKLQTRSWDGEDGKKRYTTEIVVNQMQFLGSRGNENSTSEESKPATDAADFETESQEKDLPF